MGVGNEPDRETQGAEQQALEEIRRLFERYRRTARHGLVAERDEPADLQHEETEKAPALTGR